MEGTVFRPEEQFSGSTRIWQNQRKKYLSLMIRILLLFARLGSLKNPHSAYRKCITKNTISKNTLFMKGLLSK